MAWCYKARDGKLPEGRKKWRKNIKKGRTAPFFKELTVEEETVLVKLEAKSILTKVNALVNFKNSTSRSFWQPPMSCS